MKFKTLVSTLVIGSVIATQALAWGSAGHRMIGEEAMRGLPSYLPGFLRSSTAITSVGEFSREPDRMRGASKPGDNDRLPAHYINLDTDGKIDGMTLDTLPPNRTDYDVKIRAAGSDPFEAGYLPYAMADAYAQVAKDMGYWRVLSLMEQRETDIKKKAWYRADRQRREAVMLRDIGILSHYVGDASQPLHVTSHYNGWGKGENPDSYTTDPIHGPFEGVFVNHNITTADVRANLGAYTPCTTKPEQCLDAEILVANAQVVPLYQMQKAGELVDGNADMKTFVAKQLGLGATTLRNALVDAWRDSKSIKLGYPAYVYDDFVAGKVEDPWISLYGGD
ncbi:MAG: hypothetical protein JF571_00560 [Asticcacaulis sp.]|nr:hypothetical protein [Asticcacaulis sp.]